WQFSQMTNGCQENDIKRGRADCLARPERVPAAKAFPIAAAVETGIYFILELRLRLGDKGEEREKEGKKKDQEPVPHTGLLSTHSFDRLEMLMPYGCHSLAAGLSRAGRLVNDKDSCRRPNEIVDFRHKMAGNRSGVRVSGSESDADAAK
ncbi:MAG: hypothetical protein WC674_10265, partial [Candidatus Krumholzibacteriia bacterium]